MKEEENDEMYKGTLYQKEEEGQEVGKEQERVIG